MAYGQFLPTKKGPKNKFLLYVFMAFITKAQKSKITERNSSIPNLCRKIFLESGIAVIIVVIFIVVIAGKVLFILSLTVTDVYVSAAVVSYMCVCESYILAIVFKVYYFSSTPKN